MKKIYALFVTLFAIVFCASSMSVVMAADVVSVSDVVSNKVVVTVIGTKEDDKIALGLIDTSLPAETRNIDFCPISVIKKDEKRKCTFDLKNNKKYLIVNYTKYTGGETAPTQMSFYSSYKTVKTISTSGGGGNTGASGGGGNTGASGGGGNTGGEPMGLEDPIGEGVTIDGLISKLLDIIVTVGTPLVAFFFILTGFKYVSAQGNEEKLKSAKSAAIGTVIGAICVLGAWTFAQAIKGSIEDLRSALDIIRFL